MVSSRRVRGALLRLARRRALSIGIGLVLVLPAACAQLGRGFDEWWAEGLSLVLAATGAAFVWIGVVGITPDWIE